MSVLELDGVSKTYPSKPPVAALRRVDLRVAAAERVAVVGPSGSGKTTLLHILGTLERPSFGSVRIAGTDTAALSDASLSGLRSRRIGFVFQQFHLLDHLRAEENVALGLLYHGLAAGVRREAALAALQRVGLTARARHRPNELSGGECQRVAIARAIVGGPAVVLADEPTGNLDSATAASVIDLLAGLAEGGTAVIVITHDAEIAARMDRRVTMRDGAVIADTGSPE